MLELKGRKMRKQLERMERLHGLIKRKGTGTALECADKLGISERHLYNMLEMMRDMDVPVVYDKHISSYVYTEEVEFHFGFTIVERN